MKKMLLHIILCLFVFTANTQNLVSFKDVNNKYGYKDSLGNIVISPKYDSGSPFHEGLASVNVGGYWDLHTVYRSNSINNLPALGGGKWGYIDKTGKEVIPIQYDFAWDFSEGFAIVVLKEKWGFIDTTGKEVIPIQYDAINTNGFSEGLVAATINGKSGMIDKTGKEVIPFKYDGIGTFSEGMVLAILNNQWGYIDKTGEEVIPIKYEQVRYFSEGIAAVKLNGKWGYIDRTGKVIIPIKYDYVESFSDGEAEVRFNELRFYINKNGEQITGFLKESELQVSFIKDNATWTDGKTYQFIKVHTKIKAFEKKHFELGTVKLSISYDYATSSSTVQEVLYPIMMQSDNEALFLIDDFDGLRKNTYITIVYFINSKKDGTIVYRYSKQLELLDIKNKTLSTKYPEADSTWYKKWKKKNPDFKGERELREERK